MFQLCIVNLDGFVVDIVRADLLIEIQTRNLAVSEGEEMIATVWTNGNTELGVKISAKDRDQFFNKEWSYVTLELEGLPYPLDVNVNKPSFWRWQYVVLTHRVLGDWLTGNGLAHWRPRRPPKLILESIGNRRFRLRRRANVIPE
jgi:hypothetical protein